MIIGGGWWEPDGKYPSNGGAHGPFGSYQRQQYLYCDSTLTTTSGGAVATDQNLKSLTFPTTANPPFTTALNQVNRFLRFRASGLVSTQAVGPTWRMKVQLGTLVTLIVFADQPLVGSLVAAPWSLDGEITIVTSGAAATLDAHAELKFRNSVAAGASTIVHDPNAVLSGAIDLTAQQTLLFTAAFPTNTNAGNIAYQRKLVVEMFDGSTV